MQKKTLNFNAGPAELPQEVLQEASEVVRQYKNTGLSVLELPHRGGSFLEIIEESKALIRELCNIGSEYEVLWMQGGGRMQFCMVPMNLLHNAAGYIDSGHWAEEAMEYAQHYGAVHNLASSKEDKYARLPQWPDSLPADLSYVHMTTNNTIYGTQWHNVPVCNAPLIADMSSDILSCHRDYSRYTLFYAAAQKNLGIAGNTLVVIHRDLLRINRMLPPMLSYKAQVKENSILNTSNVFGIYVSLLMLRWTKTKGIDAIVRDNETKAKLLYDALDSSDKFIPHVTEKAHRSYQNVCFTARTPEIEKHFISLCEQHNVKGIKGHRSIGGFRASIYNAVPVAAVEELVALMKQ